MWGSTRMDNPQGNLQTIYSLEYSRRAQATILAFNPPTTRLIFEHLGNRRDFSDLKLVRLWLYTLSTACYFSFVVQPLWIQAFTSHPGIWLFLPYTRKYDCTPGPKKDGFLPLARYSWSIPDSLYDKAEFQGLPADLPEPKNNVGCVNPP